VTHHLESVPAPGEHEDPWFEADDPGFDGGWFDPIPRPPWWRWVALVVILALVVATPFAYVLSLLLD